MDRCRRLCSFVPTSASLVFPEQTGCEPKMLAQFQTGLLFYLIHFSGTWMLLVHLLNLLPPLPKCSASYQFEMTIAHCSYFGFSSSRMTYLRSAPRLIRKISNYCHISIIMMNGFPWFSIRRRIEHMSADLV